MNAATIAVLLAKGLSGVDVLDVARAMEAVEQAESAAEKRKAYDRKRKRDARASAKSAGQSVGNPPDPAPNDIDILTPTLTPVISSEITPPAQNDDDPEIKPEHVLEAFNAMAVRAGIPTARMTPERRKKLIPFIRRHPIDDITEAISAIECTPFCRGENDRGWRANFDFLLQPSSFTKLIEGTYGQ